MGCRMNLRDNPNIRVLTVSCSHCGAQAGDHCISNGQPCEGSHGYRWDALDATGENPTMDNEDPDRTFLGLLRRELQTAAVREKETRAALAEHQAKADHLTKERERILAAIKAYEGGFQ
jgi:hypothetical protein